MVLLMCFAFRRRTGIREADSDDLYLDRYTMASDDLYLDRYTMASSSGGIEVVRRRKSIWSRRRSRDPARIYTTRPLTKSTAVHLSQKVARTLPFRASRATRSVTSSYGTDSTRSIDVPWYSRVPSYWPFRASRATRSVTSSSYVTDSVQSIDIPWYSRLPSYWPFGSRRAARSISVSSGSSRAARSSSIASRTASTSSSGASGTSSMHAIAVHWYSRLLGHWPFLRTADANLPVSAPTTSSGSSMSIEGQPETTHRFVVGLKPGSWVHRARQWFMARWPQSALSEVSGSSSATRSMSSLEASSPNIFQRRHIAVHRRQRHRDGRR